MNIRKMIDKLLGIYDLKANLSKNNSINYVTNNEFNDVYMFDFKQGFRSGGFDNPTTGIYINNIDGSHEPQEDGSQTKNTETIKVKVKPIDVLDQLETVPTPFNLELIDEKISILKDKRELIKQEYTKRELSALMERMENRKKYSEHRLFFESFTNTTEDKIKALTTKHDLVMETADIFIPEFPDEAVSIMVNYTKEVEKITDKKLVFYVIAEKEDFKQADDKRDPILLVQSPFGFYYQILGAWDKEMLILHEL